MFIIFLIVGPPGIPGERGYPGESGADGMFLKKMFI